LYIIISLFPVEQEVSEGAKSIRTPWTW